MNRIFMKKEKKKKFTNAVNFLINHFPPICRKSFSPHFFKTFFRWRSPANFSPSTEHFSKKNTEKNATKGKVGGKCMIMKQSIVKLFVAFFIFPPIFRKLFCPPPRGGVVLENLNPWYKCNEKLHFWLR